MKLRITLLVVTVFAFAGSLLLAQGQKAPQQPPTLTQVVDRSFAGMEREFVSVADAMPEDRYSFKPTDGEFKDVRTFAEQVKHVAAVNYLLGAALLGEKPPVDTGGEKGPDSAHSKADIMKFLKDSFAYGHKAIATITDKTATELIPSPFGSGKTNRLAMGMLYTGHGFDHYGQMVVYQRMNGIIPPPSRPQPSK